MAQNFKNICMDNVYKRIAGNLDNIKNLCCENPEVKEVLDLTTGDVFLAKDIIGSDVNKAMKLRRELAIQHKIDKDDQLLMICPYCHNPLRLNCRLNGHRFYFAHIQRENNCPQLDKKNWPKDRILAAKYNGQKESIPHKLMKEDLRNILKLDPKFSDIKVEEVVKGTDPSKRRKPDVRALYEGKIQIVFEIQLSTTFLDVVLERREFYRNKNELLIWVFQNFSLKDARMMEFDTFHANNMNAIVLDQEASYISKQKSKLFFKCIWVEPEINNKKLSHSEHSTIIEFDQLNKDIDKQQIFRFDYDSKRRSIEEELEKYRKVTKIQNLRNDFFSHYDPTMDTGSLVKYASQFFQEISSFDNTIKRLLFYYLRIMNAAKTGNPTTQGSGWNFDNFKSIYNEVYTSHKSFYFLFCCSMKAYGRNEKSDSIESRKREAWKSIRLEGEKSKFHHDALFTIITEKLFPEAYNVYKRLISMATNKPPSN